MRASNDVPMLDRRRSGAGQYLVLRRLRPAPHAASSHRTAVEGSQTDQTGVLEHLLPGGDVSVAEVAAAAYALSDVHLVIQVGVQQACGDGWPRSPTELDWYVEKAGNWSWLATGNVRRNLRQSAGPGRDDVYSAGRGSAHSRRRWQSPSLAPADWTLMLPCRSVPPESLGSPVLRPRCPRQTLLTGPVHRGPAASLCRRRVPSLRRLLWSPVVEWLTCWYNSVVGRPACWHYHHLLVDRRASQLHPTRWSPVYQLTASRAHLAANISASAADQGC